MGIRWAHQGAPRRRCANRRTRIQRRLTAQQIAPKRGLHEVASTENPASRLLLGVKAGSYRRRERLLQYVLAVRGAVSEQTVNGVAQGRKAVSADLEGDE